MNISKHLIEKIKKIQGIFQKKIFFIEKRQKNLEKKYVKSVDEKQVDNIKKHIKNL